MSNNYRRIATEVEAFKWNGPAVESEEIPDVPLDIPGDFRRHLVMHRFRKSSWLPYDITHNRWVLVGSWLIIEHGRLYIVPQDSVFEKLYEPIVCLDQEVVVTTKRNLRDLCETAYNAGSYDEFDSDYRAMKNQLPGSFEQWWKLNQPVNGAILI